MDGAGDERLTGAGLAGHEHGGLAGGDRFDHVVDVFHPRIGADDVIHAVTLIELLTKIDVLGNEGVLVDGLLHGDEKSLIHEGLGELVNRAVSDRLHRRFDGAETGDGDRHDVGMTPVN